MLGRCRAVVVGPFRLAQPATKKRCLTDAVSMTFLSVAMLATVIWSVRFLIPRSIKERQRFGFICAVMVAVLALVIWLLAAEPAIGPAAPPGPPPRA
jgi:hypothetical protein